MSLTWKIILLLAVAATAGTTVVVYKNRSAAPTNETASQNTTAEQKTYNPNAKPITDAEIDLLIKEAGTESNAEFEEETDTTLINSEKQELNNFDNAYVPTDF